jgi:hypothetical protein
MIILVIKKITVYLLKQKKNLWIKRLKAYRKSIGISYVVKV